MAEDRRPAKRQRCGGGQASTLRPDAARAHLRLDALAELPDALRRFTRRGEA